MKSQLFFTTVLLPALVTSSFAQEATGTRSATASSVLSSPGSTATSSLDLEDEWVECFKDCFRKYGKLDSCPYADISFDACWCTDDDWTEREEDCVWDVCSPAAKNEYHIIRPRVCETVSIPANTVPNLASQSTDQQSSSIVSTSTLGSSSQTTSVQQTSEQQSRQTTTSASNTETQNAESSSTPDAAASTTTGATAAATETPNGTGRITWSSSKATGFILLATSLYMLL